MTKSEIFKRLLPGFLPIVIFIIADEFLGTLWGLVVAILFAIGELVIGYIKDQSIDRFILFDVGLLVALGTVSIILENDLFFKLKPGVISLLMTGLIGFSVYSKHNIMLMLSQRYMKGIDMNPMQVWQMQQSMKRVFWMMLVYSILTIASSFIESKATWAFLSGPGLVVVFALFFGLEWLIKKKQVKEFGQEEWVPLVDANGRINGSAPRSIVHGGSMLLHPVVHLHVYHNDGIWLQKRPVHKKIQPDKWDTAVGGHVDMGEDIEKALARETREEINLTNFDAKALKPYVWQSAIERELVFVFITNHAGPFSCDTNEVEDIRLWSHDEIKSNLGKEIFTPNFEYEYKNLLMSK